MRIDPAESMRDRPLHPAVHIEQFGDDSSVGVDDVLALWGREHVVVGDEALRRVDEVVAVAVAEEGELVGVSTAAERFVPRLGVSMWGVRVFVSEDVRNGNVAAHLLDACRRVLGDRGADPSGSAEARSAGVMVEVQNPGLQRVMNQAVWQTTRFAYIGDNEQGEPVRVRYFDGATVPAEPVRGG